VQHDGMPYDPIQGQGHGGPTCENGLFQSGGMYVIKRLMVNYDTPKQF